MGGDPKQSRLLPTSSKRNVVVPSKTRVDTAAALNEAVPRGETRDFVDLGHHRYGGTEQRTARMSTWKAPIVVPPRRDVQLEVSLKQQENDLPTSVVPGRPSHHHVTSLPRAADALAMPVSLYGASTVSKSIPSMSDGLQSSALNDLSTKERSQISDARGESKPGARHFSVDYDQRENAAAPKHAMDTSEAKVKLILEHSAKERTFRDLMRLGDLPEHLWPSHMRKSWSVVVDMHRKELSRLGPSGDFLRNDVLSRKRSSMQDQAEGSRVKRAKSQIGNPHLQDDAYRREEPAVNSNNTRSADAAQLSTKSSKASKMNREDRRQLRWNKLHKSLSDDTDMLEHRRIEKRLKMLLSTLHLLRKKCLNNKPSTGELKRMLHLVSSIEWFERAIAMPKSQSAPKRSSKPVKRKLVSCDNLDKQHNREQSSWIHQAGLNKVKRKLWPAEKIAQWDILRERQNSERDAFQAQFVMSTTDQILRKLHYDSPDDAHIDETLNEIDVITQGRSGLVQNSDCDQGLDVELSEETHSEESDEESDEDSDQESVIELYAESSEDDDYQPDQESDGESEKDLRIQIEASLQRLPTNELAKGSKPASDSQITSFSGYDSVEWRTEFIEKLQAKPEQKIIPVKDGQWKAVLFSRQAALQVVPSETHVQNPKMKALLQEHSKRIETWRAELGITEARPMSSFQKIMFENMLFNQSRKTQALVAEIEAETEVDADPRSQNHVDPVKEVKVKDEFKAGDAQQSYAQAHNLVVDRSSWNNAKMDGIVTIKVEDDEPKTAIGSSSFPKSYALPSLGGSRKSPPPILPPKGRVGEYYGIRR